MRFLEKDLEDIIWESDNKKLQEKGLNIYGNKIRQLKIGNYGISDLITYSKKYYFNEIDGIYIPYIDITVYELKKEKIGISAFLQSLRYSKGIKTYLEKRNEDLNYVINITLCAKDIDLSGDFIYITDLFSSYCNFHHINDVNFYTFDYMFDGIKFKKHSDYNLIHKGF